MQKHQVMALLMGDQACVFYGAAQFSKDINFLILAEDENFEGLHAALGELKATRIAVPGFDPRVLDRGHAVHYRCKATGVEGLRVDIMTKLRDLPDFSILWDRRTTIIESDGQKIDLLSVPGLVNAKKTQRMKDWPMISALVEGHYDQYTSEPNPSRIDFWLRESRVEDRLIDLVVRFPAEAAAMAASTRPLLTLAITPDLPRLREALDAEVRAEQEKDRIYWEPLKREMEEFRRAERRES
jgi:hypothetical protein